MNNLVLPSEYLVMGAMLCFFFITSCHFLFIVPKVAPNRSEATKALHKMAVIQLVYNGLLYLLWLLPVFVEGRAIDFYLENDPRWATYDLVMDYLDMTILPIGMLMGHVVTRGKLPSVKMGMMQVMPFAIALVIDLIFDLPVLRSSMGIFALVYSIFQFVWYGRCVRIHEIFLLNNYSNIEGCEMKWYLKAQMPVFLLSLLYYPLVVLPEATWPSIVYDLCSLCFLFYLVSMISTHEMDDRAYSLVEKVDFTKKKSEIFNAAIEEAKNEAPAAAEPAASLAAKAPKAAQAEEPKVWTRTEKESYDFGEQMKKLEEEEFYLDPDVNIDYLANELGTNRHYVSNYLNQILKMPFYAYVNKLRLEHAEMLLRTSNDKASAIGYLCGFNSEATFRRLFKEQYGCTPTQYVKQAS